MSQDKRSMFAQIFTALMIFCGLVWFWTVVFIMAWPWEKNTEWKPEFRIPAVCADGELCGIPHGELAKGQFKSFSVPDAADVMEDKNWLRWTTKNGVVEVKASSWHFQTTIRYKLEDGKPVLLEVQDVGPQAIYYGIAAALLSLVGIFWRKLSGAV